MAGAYPIGSIAGLIRISGAQSAQRDILGVQRSMSLTGETAGRAAAGIGKTEAALGGVGTASTRAASGSAKFRASQLSALAANERYNTVLADEDASLARLAAAEAAVIRANERMKASAVGAAAPVARLGAEAEASGGMMSRAATSVGGLARTAAGLGVALGGFELAKKGAEFIGAGKDLTTALNGVQAAAHATDAEMAAVRTQAIGLGKDLTVPAATAVDAAQAVEDLVRAGMTLPRAMAAARPALLLAAAAQVDTADAARFLGDTLDDFQLPADQAAHVANVLAGAATSAGGGLSDMFDAIKYAGPYARAAQVPVEDLVTAIADLAKGGIQGSMSGTGLRMMLQSLAKNAPAAQKALADLGVVAFDAQGRFVGLRNLIGQLHDAQASFGDDSKRFLADISTAFGARASTIVASLAHKGVEGYDQFAKRVGSGDVQKYADLMNRGFSANMTQIRKQLTAAGIDVYQKLEPALSSAANWLGTTLPHDLGVLSSILGPTVHLVGDGLGGAWQVATVAMHAADDVLGPIAHFLEQHEGLTTGVATGVLSMWAAWKLWTIARVAVLGIGNLLSGLGTKMAATALVPARLTTAVDAAAANTQLAAIKMGASWDMVAEKSVIAAATVEGATTEVAASAAAAAAEVEAAGATASIGWSAMLGPLALVGLGVGLFTGLMHSNSEAAHVNAAEVNALTQAIKDDSGALGEHTRAQVVDQLQQAGALDAARALHMSLSDVTDAALKGGPALRGLTGLLKIESINSYGATDAQAAHAAMARKLLGILTDQHGAVLKSIQAYRNEKDASQSSAAAAEHHAAAVQHDNTMLQWNINAHGALVQTSVKSGSALDNTTAAMQRQTVASGLLKNALDYLNGVNETVEQTTDSFNIALGNLRSGMSLVKAKNGDVVTSLNQSTVAGATNRQMFVGILDAAKASAQAVADHARQQGASLPEALAKGNAALAANETAIRNAASAIGLNKGQVNDLITAMGQLAKIHAKPKVTVDPHPAITGIAAVEYRLAHLHDKTVTVTVLSANAAENANGRASGGSLPEGVSALGERGPELAIKNGPHVAILSNPQSHKFLAATGMRAPGFAAGTDPSPTGERATLNPRAFLGASSASAERSAFSGLLDIAKRAGLSGPIVSELKHENKELTQAIKDRNHLDDLVDKANARLVADEKKRAAELKAVKTAITGSFDVTTAGAGFDGSQPVSGGSMIAQEKQAALRAKTFVTDIKKLSGKVGDAYLYQLAEKGPDALPEVQALLSLSPKQLRGFRADEQSLSQSGQSLGQFIGKRRFGGQITDDRAELQLIRHADASAERNVKLLGDRIVKQLEHAVGHLSNPKINIYLPNGKQLATVVQTGNNHNARKD